VPSSHNDGTIGTGHGGGTVSRAIQDDIGERLRIMYDALKENPVPERLLDLLKQLDKPQSDESP
jgi:Anti-sigma factor NepR